MQLSRATALIAVLLIVVLAVGYAAAEDEGEAAAQTALNTQR